jgi:hypothetical protein
VTAPGGSGTRARTRELGAAEAWRDISHLIGDAARRWKGTGEQQLDLTAHALALALAEELRRLADYAHSASMTYELPDLGDFLTDTLWNPRWSGPAPAELPQRDQSENS